jgi:hypothetical protein
MRKMVLIHFYMINFFCPISPILRKHALTNRFLNIFARFKAYTFLLLISIVLFAVFLPATSLAAKKQSESITVQGSVGGYYLSISGYISPFASIVLTSDGIFYRATVADKYGNFSISQMLIKTGFSHFCLEAIDIKRIGESYTCFNFPPTKGSFEMRDIFLPPTLGLSRTEIAAGGSVIAAGYTMPWAKVTLHLSNGKILTTTANGEGFYQFKLENIKAGKYELYSTSEYENKQSLEPTRKAKLTALNVWEQLLAFIRNIFNKAWRFLTSLSLGPLWIGIPIIISIIILILKIWPEKFTFIYTSKLFALLPPFRRRRKKLHHAWWMGY